MNTRLVTLMTAVCGLLITGALRAETVPLFGGNNSYVEIGTPSALQVPSNNPITVEGWMRFNSLTTRDMLYCKNNGRNAAPYSFLVGFADNKLSAFYTSSWKGNFAVTRQLGRWYHVAFSFNGATMSFYLDGELLGTDAFSFVNTAAHTVKIGGYTASADNNGNVSDVRVWNYARSQEQIQNDMNRRLAGEEAGLLAYWPLDEGSGTVVADRSSNGCDGTLVNASWPTNNDLSLLDFVVVNPVTGSKRFTNTNRLNVARLPVPNGYTDYQITQGGALPDANAWISTNAPQEMIELDLSGSDDATVTLTAWLTNSSASVELQRFDREVIFTSQSPIPAIHTTYSRQVIPGCGAIFYPEDLNDASSGGEAFSKSIPVHSLWLQRRAGPATDVSPEAPWVTLHEAGDYELDLVVVNAAGNVATSSVCLAEALLWNGEPFIWTGAVDNNWFERLNWDFKTVPCTGAAVVVDDGANVTLSGSSAALKSLVVSNATLTFANWDTVLTADTFYAGSGAVITHDGPITHNGMSNRVHIVCSNFTLTAGATIALNDKGYIGTRNGTTGNFGNGPGRSTVERGAASHGGRGGVSNSGPTYGDPDQPIYLGSSGDGQYNATGAHGGGAVRIAVSSRAIVNGAILASSSDVGSNSGGGSGGSIFLTAATVVATNGVLHANGASTTQMGGGGGGRIAVIVTDPAAQATLPRVLYELSVKGGTAKTSGALGTIYLNDLNLMSTILNNCNGCILGIDDWTWTVPELAMTNSWLVIAGKMALSVAGDMRLMNAILDPATLAATVGGDMDMYGTSALYVRSGPTNGVAPWGTTVDIVGTLSLGTGSTIYPASNPTNGGSVCFTVGDLLMESGSAINADGLGFAGAPKIGYGPGRGKGSNGGGGYGGDGGRPPNGGGTYGSSTAPSDPGSGGAGNNNYSGTAAGGLIRLHVAGTATIDGTISANGLSAGNNQGCGSGGGVYLEADTLSTAFGTICANGGNNASTYYGAGGGGRIALRYRIDNFDGTITVAGGTGTYFGQDGTLVREVDATYASLTITGEPERHGAGWPYDYGLNGVLTGAVVTNTVNSPADEADGQHFVCLGWSATNALDEAFSGGSTQAVLTISHDTWLTWNWTNRYHLAATASVGGTLAVDPSGWYTSGLSVTVTAVADSGYRFLQWSGPGLPHEVFLSNPLTLSMDRTREVQAVFVPVSAPVARASARSGEWLAPDTWLPPGTPGEGDTLTIAGHTLTLNDPSRAAALTLSGSGRLDLGERVRLYIAGATTVTGGTARLNLNHGSFVGGGNLNLLAGAQMLVHSGPCDFPESYDHTHPPATAYGSLVHLGGDLNIASNSVLFSKSHSATNGGTALFRMHKLTVATGGRFDADSLGYPAGPSSYVLGGYGPGAGGIDRGAGSYGGKGGSGTAGGSGPTYGSTIAPVQAGSSSGGAYGTSGRAGGGAIRVEATRWIRVDGTITANGVAGPHHDCGGGAGGSVYLTCAGLSGSGEIQARGGDHVTRDAAGGGGRIAIWTAQVTFDTNRTDAITAAAGLNLTTEAPGGEDGTIYWRMRPMHGTLILLR